MRVILWATPSLASDALRVGLLASQACRHVDILNDELALAATLRLGIDAVIIDASRPPRPSAGAIGQLAAMPTIYISFAPSAVARASADDQIAVETSMAGVISRLRDLRLPRMPEPEVRRLSPREAEVLRHLAAGLTNREIAALLAISIKTVDTHRGQLLKKLGLRNNSDLTRFALRDGIGLGRGHDAPSAR